ncbi:MAG: hypothetical protein LIO63_00690 [Akkermansia sp.]|nr:hypothetical protein [Akkermansia sp.]MCD8070344.1 hypothetical protein [Akkermansiaceae bacterium]
MKSLLAAVLSLFVPGLGQLYKSRFLQAVVWFVVVLAFDALFSFFLFWPFSIILHLACALQAFALRNE